MTTKSSSRKPRSGKANPRRDVEERIRKYAYQLYEQRGRVDGFALDDWLQAESEILGARKGEKVEVTRGSK